MLGFAEGILQSYILYLMYLQRKEMAKKKTICLFAENKLEVNK